MVFHLHHMQSKFHSIWHLRVGYVISLVKLNSMSSVWIIITHELPTIFFSLGNQIWCIVKLLTHNTQYPQASPSTTVRYVIIHNKTSLSQPVCKASKRIKIFPRNIFDQWHFNYLDGFWSISDFPLKPNRSAVPLNGIVHYTIIVIGS